MHSSRTRFAFLATGLVASLAYAQNDPKPLNLALPPNSATAVSETSVSAAPPATSESSGGVNPAAMAVGDPNAAAACEDPKQKNKAQLHGSVGAGVVAGNHVSGNYQTATVNVTQPLGDCEHPKGSLSITAHVSKGRFSYSGNH